MPKGVYKRTPEHKRKITEGKLGKRRNPFTEEHKRKISESNMGKNTKPRSEVTKNNEDSTAKIRICLNCERVLTRKTQQKFCNFICYTHYTLAVNEIEKQKRWVIRERNKWKKTTPNMFFKFYNMLWNKKGCSICGATFTNSLHISLVPGFDPEKVVADSFIIYCPKCFKNITRIKDEMLISEDD